MHCLTFTHCIFSQSTQEDNVSKIRSIQSCESFFELLYAFLNRYFWHIYMISSKSLDSKMENFSLAKYSHFYQGNRK